MAAIAADGLKRNREDISIHSAMVESLLPKWGGNAQALDRYIKQATEQMRPVYGSGMHARLYSNAESGHYGSALFEDSHADWDKMKQGYEDMLARFPPVATSATATRIWRAERKTRRRCCACSAKSAPGRTPKPGARIRNGHSRPAARRPCGCRIRMA